MYQDRSHNQTREPTCFMVDVRVTLETNVREIDGGGLIWSGLSQSFNPRECQRSDLVGEPEDRQGAGGQWPAGIAPSPTSRALGPRSERKPTGVREQTPPQGRLVFHRGLG